MKTLISTGHFSWNAIERRSDRYGSVRIFADENTEESVLVDEKIPFSIEGKTGRLIAKVINPVKSPHMGDLARGLKGRTPEKGQEFVFGEGVLFFEHFDSGIVHEQSNNEKQDDKMMDEIMKLFAGITGATIGLLCRRDEEYCFYVEGPANFPKLAKSNSIIQGVATDRKVSFA